MPLRSRRSRLRTSRHPFPSIAGRAGYPAARVGNDTFGLALSGKPADSNAMRIGNSTYGYLALMAGGILSLATHSFRTGVLVGALILMLSWLYGRTGRSFTQHRLVARLGRFPPAVAVALTA